MNSPKLKDIAQEAGVSLATASFVLNGKGKISKDVRKRVFEAAEKLGYRKNVYASSVARKNFIHIAILVFEDFEKAFEWNFILPIIVQLEAVMTAKGYYPVLIPVNLKLSTRQVLDKIHAAGTRAIFSIHYGNPELFYQLEDMGIPVILINNADYQDRFHSVCVDNFQGAYEGAMYLIRLGHRKIAYLDYHETTEKSVTVDRFVGFKKALDEHRITFPLENKRRVHLFDTTELQNALNDLFSSPEKPTAIFAHDDYIAASVVAALRFMGLRVPEDISVLAPGGDTLDYKLPVVPKITTMRIDAELMGRLAGELMMNRLVKEPEQISVLKVKQQIMERESCRKLR